MEGNKGIQRQNLKPNLLQGEKGWKGDQGARGDIGM